MFAVRVLSTIMSKAKKADKKGKAQDEEFALPPPLQVKEREDSANSLQLSPGLKEEKSLEARALDFTTDDDEAALDAEIQQLERSFHDTQNQLLESEKRIRLKNKREKANKLKEQLETAQRKLKRNEEIGEKVSSSSESKKDQLKEQSKQKSSVHFAESSENLDSIFSSFSDDDQLCISDLRKMKHVKQKAKKKLASLGVFSSSDSSSSSSSSYFDDSSSSEDTDSTSKKKKRHKKKKKSKSKKSGMTKKASDKVLYPQVWPQSFLQYEFVSEKTKFENLDMKMFVAGELEIILSGTVTSCECKGRLKLLKKIMYYANVYEWKGLLMYYAAWVRRIEMGLNTWSDDSANIETPMLAKHVLKKKADKTSLSKSDQIWWCADFNNNKCSYSTKTHQKTVKGHMRTVNHICATCWRKDSKQLGHPETSAACPYRK